MAKKVELKGKITMDTSAFERGLNKAVKRAAVAGAAIGAAMAAGIFKSIQAASDLNETLTKTEAIFGAASKSIEAWAAGAARAFGQSKKQAMDAAATFGIFGKSAGLTDERLGDFSKTLTQLASDFASFYNTSVDDAIAAIGSGLQGQALPLRRFGILLDQATIQQEALRMGLIQTTTQALTPQQKVLASYNVILGQSKDAQGDFARTSDGLANSQRIFKAELENLSAEIGQNFLPLAQQAVVAGRDMLSFFSESGAIESFANALALIPSLLAEITAGFYEVKAAANTSLGVALRSLTPSGAATIAPGASDAAYRDAKEKAEFYRGAAAGLAQDAVNKRNGRASGKGTAGSGQSLTPGDVADLTGGAGEVSPAAERVSSMMSGEGIFSPSYLTLGTGAGQSGLLGAGVTAPSELEMFDNAAIQRAMEPIKKAGAFDKFGTAIFEGFKTSTTPGDPSGKGFQFGAVGGIGPEVSGVEGGAYGTIRRGDAARRKQAERLAEEERRKQEEAENDPLVKAINHPAWVTEGV